MKYVFIHPFGFDFHFLANIAVQLLKTHCQMISNIVLLFLFFFFYSGGQTGTSFTFYSDEKRIHKSELGFWSLLDCCYWIFCLGLA